jgi:hypothetical protein
MLDGSRILVLHDLATAHWHTAALSAPAPASTFEQLVLDQHRANYDLWHEEDAARDPSTSDAGIARVKRSIDKLNQRRNDLAEQLDLTLLADAGNQSTEAPLHSETPGLIIDRLSILSLKIFHTAEQASRAEAGEAHCDRNRQRLEVLQAQRSDLAACLSELWTDILAGHRRFKLYRQLKMYNDPTLNPVLYREARNVPSGSPSPHDVPAAIDQTGSNPL